MTKMRKRVEGLERRLIPAAPVTVHIVGQLAGESEAEARARYGQSIAEGDHIIMLVGVAPGGDYEAAQ